MNFLLWIVGGIALTLAALTLVVAVYALQDFIQSLKETRYGRFSNH